MKRAFRILFIALIIIFFIHLIRDIMQIAQMSNFLTELWHRPNEWCRPYCNEVTLLPELFVIIGSGITLMKNKVDFPGYSVIASLALCPFFIILP